MADEIVRTLAQGLASATSTALMIGVAWFVLRLCGYEITISLQPREKR